LGSGINGNQSPYQSSPDYAGQDTLTLTIGGQTVSVQANEWASATGPGGYGIGGTVSSIPTNNLTPSQLSALQSAGFQVTNGQIEISPTAYGGTEPGGASVTYNGGETNLYGGNGALTLNVPGGTSGGSSGGGTPSGYSGGGSSGSGLAWSVSLAPSATQAQAGQPVALTATTNQQLGPTPYWLLIENDTGSILASCGGGTTCSTTQTETSAATQTFRAYVANANGSDVQATSTPATVQWQAPAPTISSPVFQPDPALPTQAVQATVQAANATSVSLAVPGGGTVALHQAGSGTWTGTLTAPAPGTYAVTATATGQGGSADANGTLTVRATVPTAAFSVSPNPLVADWQSVAYTDQSSAGGYGAAIAREAWSLSGPGGSWSGESASALPTMFQTPGSYTVTLSVTNSYGASASVSHTLTVLPAPTLNITVTPSLAEPGQQVTVSASWSGWSSASIDVGAFGAGTWPQAGSGTWSQPFTPASSGTYSACIVGSLAGQTRQACASTTILAPTSPILTQ
jgi:hypothetical protein